MKNAIKCFSGALTLAAACAFSSGCSEMRCESDANCSAALTCFEQRCVSDVGSLPATSADAGPDDPALPVEEEQPACPSVGGIAYERPKPNVMFLVDRSGSMGEPGACDQAPCPSKWQQLLALGSYLEEVKGHARFGMSVFPAPGDDGCGVSAGLMVPLSESPDVGELILGTLQSTAPGGRTPMALALDELAANGGLSDPDRDNVIVLLTDGQPNCTCGPDEPACERTAAIAAVERLATGEVPVLIDVVGFGASAEAASETLSAMAVAAGTALPGPTKHFEARTIEELVGRLFQLTAGLAPCRFNLDDWPAPDDLLVHLDDGEVAPCTTESCVSGYSYDESSGVVELHGDTCQAIRDGQCHDVWFESR